MSLTGSHGYDQTRFNVAVGVAYGSDVEKVKEAMWDSARFHPKVEKNPEPVVRFVDFGDSALIFEVLFWTKDPFYVEFTKSDIRFDIEMNFKKYNIKIPFPQRDLHIVSDFRLDTKPNGTVV